MKSQRPASDKSILQNSDGFSLANGGPLYQLLCRAQLTDDMLSFMRWRVIVI